MSMQVEFPFLRYNLFYYVYMLSHFASARTDRRYRKAFDALASKLDDAGQMVVERPHRGLKELAFCAHGKPSVLATRRYETIVENMSR